MVFGSRQKLSELQDFSLSLLEKNVKSAKDLGVTLDTHLSYNEHITKTVSSCMTRLRQIHRVKHVFDKQTLVTVINALVFSRLFYCSNVWANATSKNLNKLQSVHNFACCNVELYLVTNQNGLDGGKGTQGHMSVPSVGVGRQK